MYRKVIYVLVFLCLTFLGLMLPQTTQAAEQQIYPDNLGRNDTLQFNYKTTHTKSGDTDCFDSEPQELSPAILHQEGDSTKTYEQSNIAWRTPYQGDGCQYADYWILEDTTLNSDPGRATATWAAQRILIPTNIGKITRVTFYRVYNWSDNARFRLELHDGNTDALLNQTGEQAFSGPRQQEAVGPVTFSNLNWNVNPRANYFLRLVRTDGNISLPLLSPCKGGWYPQWQSSLFECTSWMNGIGAQEDAFPANGIHHNITDGYLSGFANSDSPRFLDISRSDGVVKADISRMAVWGEPYPIAGKVSNCQTKQGLGNQSIQVVSAGGSSQTVTTDSAGNFSVANLISGGLYSVRPQGANLKTSTTNWSFISCNNQNKDTPYGQSSYECQLFGSNDCAGPAGDGSIGRCNFCYEANPDGYFDGGSCSALAGWTCDADNYNTPLRVDFYADGPAGQGTGVGSVPTASLTREAAVANQCGGNGNHGFSFAVPANSILWDEKPHNIYAYGINIGTGTNTLLPGSPKPVTCTSPTINLHVSNGGNPGGTFQTSGRQALSTEGGSGYYNPINIYLETTKGSANLKQYYVSFYDPSLYDASLNSPSLMNFLQTRIDKDPAKGFLLAYGAGQPLDNRSDTAPQKPYAWNPRKNNCLGGWEDISEYSDTGTGFDIKNCAGAIYYQVLPQGAGRWQVKIFKSLGSKRFFTAAEVIDLNNKAAFNPNINPVP